MRSGNHPYGTVLQRDISQHQTDREHIVVGVGIEGMVLVPIDYQCTPWRFADYLAVMKTYRTLDQLCNHVR